MKLTMISALLGSALLVSAIPTSKDATTAGQNVTYVDFSNLPWANHSDGSLEKRTPGGVGIIPYVKIQLLKS
jgi:hypothetical protein